MVDSLNDIEKYVDDKSFKKFLLFLDKNLLSYLELRVF